MYWLPSEGKTIAICSLPDSENERQRILNDFLLHILGNLCGDWLQTFINGVLAAFRGKNNKDTLSDPSRK